MARPDPVQNQAREEMSFSYEDFEEDNLLGNGSSLRQNPAESLANMFSNLKKRTGNGQEMDTKTETAVLHFWMCNHWTKEIFSDSSPVSYYSRRPTAMFYGGLVAENPYILDYLLTSTPKDVEATKARAPPCPPPPSPPFPEACPLPSATPTPANRCSVERSSRPIGARPDMAMASQLSSAVQLSCNILFVPSMTGPDAPT